MLTNADHMDVLIANGYHKNSFYRAANNFFLLKGQMSYQDTFLVGQNKIWVGNHPKRLNFILGKTEDILLSCKETFITQVMSMCFVTLRSS